MGLLQINIPLLYKKLPFLKKERFVRARHGTHHTVFLSEQYVIRSRVQDKNIVAREALFLSEVQHVLVPKTIWAGMLGTSYVMVENRLPGKPLHTMWKQMSAANRARFVRDVLSFLRYLQRTKKQRAYSVATGKTYRTFFDCMTDGIRKKQKVLYRLRETRALAQNLAEIVNAPGTRTLFSTRRQSIVHGDLINHNLLTDGKRLTGVLDWELAFHGDPDYDLSRLYYYRECARAYHEQGIDASYEAEYMNAVTAAIEKSGLIKNKTVFAKKHRYIRAIFFTHALFWAARSKAPKKNIAEVITLWKENGGAKREHA